MKTTTNNLADASEKKVRFLETKYITALARGEVFEVLKSIRTRIKELKAEVNEKKDRLSKM